MNLKHLVFSAISTLVVANISWHAYAQLPTKVESFAVADVRITSSPFKHAEDMDISYLLGLNADRLLSPYMKEAGLTPQAENYPNWENTGLDGHIGGHYLSALSYMYAATGNKQIKERLDYFISQLKRCQDAAGDGYLSGVPNGRKMWKEIKEGNIRASGFGLNDRWVPLYNIHKIYAGLRDAYLQTGSLVAKDMLVKLTDWMCNLTNALTDAQIQDMLRSEHGGLNEVFADVAAITGDRKYLELAHKFSQKAVLNPLLQKEDKLTGMHANTQIPKVIGFERISKIEGNNDWHQAAKFFWETVVNRRSISIGGNSVFEHFHPSEDFTSMFQSEQGPETCNTYNMLRLTKMLYEGSGDVSYLDYYERALYNHILSTIDPVQGGFVYFTPMREGHYRVYSQPQTSFWCCVGSGLENHARYGEMIYGHKDNDLFINMFIPSTLDWKSKKVQIEQQNNIPDEENTTILVNPTKAISFNLNIRRPDWVKTEDLKISVNGKDVPVVVKNGFAVVSRTWNKGDKVKVDLPMSLRTIASPDGASQYSFAYGPVVLAAKIGVQDQTGLFADDSRGGHIAQGVQYPLSQMPVLVGGKETVLQHLKKKDGDRLAFAMSGVEPSRYEGIELVPFNRLYECRYAVYFPLVSEAELKDRQEKIRVAESERLALEEKTVDKVACGQQQPESDHFILMQNSNAGADNGVHWREARGWFGYQLKNSQKNAVQIRISLKPERGRNANVFVNGQKIAQLSQVSSPNPLILNLDIPTSLSSESLLEVKIESVDSKLTPKVYEVRLIKE